MRDFYLTKDRLTELETELQKELEDYPVLIITSQTANTGKWGMAKLWRSWMAATGEFMARNGCTMPLYIRSNGETYGSRPFNQNDAHELFTAQWLGVDSDGNRLSWAKKDRDGMRAATKSERYVAMLKHEDWATTKGLRLMVPRDSEFMQIKNETGQ